ncbi:GNAT family N-acetyltransferase [Vibrio parahaemolyticus]|nr:GNAT family N-acetyltransferase [Vibrio parahaemolyticus]EJR2787960.1 GNAT family N-acetyltransferase [Vibrio parahaemolyticus]
MPIFNIKEKQIINPENISIEYKTNNKKKIAEVIAKFSKENYDSSNKSIKRQINELYDFVNRGKIEITTINMKYNNEVIAYALIINHLDINICVLGMLSTKPNYRGNGVASTLVKCLLYMYEIQGIPFFVELHKDEVAEKKGFYKQLGLNITASGLIQDNIVISNKQNFEMLEQCNNHASQKAA